ncbi:MAG TPA: ABC transporter ATP-binding protein [Candidatus Limnocylindria bacterium]|jgi:ABC-2 type transport system ATP-binding protein|nr:ABC transporter ATP-binding protein [Candidatus Limnocylindria bacterium]
MIEVAGLNKIYGDFVAVRDLSFRVQPGELLGLVGPNGAGKTTTLRCLSGIIPATSGNIQIAGHNLAENPLGAKRELAIFSDEPKLFDYLTVQQHMEFTARLYQVADATDKIPSLLAELELTDKRNQLPAELSRGMKQKAAIACGLLHSPKVILFDEPLTGLDPLAIRRMKNTIKRLANEGASIMISSHLLHLLEELCTHVLIVKQGQRAAYGTLDQVRAQFTGAAGDATLEEVFMQIAEGTSPSDFPLRVPPSPSALPPSLPPSVS